MGRQLDVENGTVPANGYGIGDDGPPSYPAKRVRRLKIQGCLALENGKGQAPTDGEKRQENRDDEKGVLDSIVPHMNHGLGLSDQGCLDDDDYQQRRDIAHDAGSVVTGGNRGVVDSPVVVELVEPRREVGDE